MTFVDHFKGEKPEEKMLEVAFGYHVVEGDLAKSIVTGSSPTHVVKVQHLLGEAFGKGWYGPLGVWFRSINRDSTKYKFHPGIQSPGNGDADQGIDSVFDLDTPHSNTAWIRLNCPADPEVGIPDFDTKNNPPTGHTGIYGCQLGDIYNSSGTVTSSGVLLVNPADVIAFLCKVVREYPNARVDWADLDTLRTLAAATVTPDYTTLPQGVGLTGKYYDGAAFTTLKAQRVDPVIQYEASTGAPALDITATDFAVRWEGKIRTRYTETYTYYLTHNDSGKLWVSNLTTALIDQASAGTHSATKAGHEDTFYDIKMEWTNASGNSEFKLEWESTSQAREVVPQDRLYPKAEAIPRFESHVKFTERTSFEDALAAVLFTCNGAFQDDDGKLRFFCVADETSSFDFDDTNIVKGTFSYYPRYTQQELLLLPNRFIAEGRDLDSRYLEPFDPPLVYDLTELQDLAGRIIEENVPVGNTRRWQGLENLAHYARLKTAPMMAEFDGMPQTLQVLAGDVVTIDKADFGINAVEFLCVEATDKSTDKAPDNRLFKLVTW